MRGSEQPKFLPDKISVLLRMALNKSRYNKATTMKPARLLASRGSSARAAGQAQTSAHYLGMDSATSNDFVHTSPHLRRSTQPAAGRLD